MLFCIIVQIILKLFIINKYIFYGLLDKDIIFKVNHRNDCFVFIQNSQPYPCYNAYKCNRSTDDFDLFVINKSNNNIHIPVDPNRKKICVMNRRNNNQLGMQLENDSIDVLHVFYDKYSQYITNKRILYFFQLGMQRLLSDKTITIGMGKRYVHNNRHGIGYNTIFNIPILSQNIDLPYSMNMGGEYWYRNFIFMLNGYYNLNQIFYADRSPRINFLEYPIAGYQVYMQSILPYISECRSQIKLEKFFYNKNHIKLFNYPNDAPSISIGIGYKPIPMLDISVDNVFVNKKYVNTLFKVALNYQFNTPIIQQIQHKYYNSKLINLNNLNAILKPFLPEKFAIKIHDDMNNILKNTHKIIGYPEEIKYVKINHNNETLLKWNIESLEQNGGKLIHLRDNLYAIHLPKYFINGDNQIVLSYEEQDDKNTIKNKSNILVLTEKFQRPSQVTEVTYNNAEILIEDISESNNTLSDIIEDPSRNNTENQNLSVVSSNEIHDHHQSHDTTSLTESKINTNDSDTLTTTIDKSLDNSYDNNIIDNNDCFVVPIPPPISKLLLSNVEPQADNIETASSSSANMNPSLSSLDEDKDGFSQTMGNDSNVHRASRSASHSKNNVYSTINLNNDKKNFSYQLMMQKRTKFASTGTQEYIDKIERSITDRKKIQYTNDIEKMFNKIHAAVSYSSLDEDWDTDDHTDDSSFSESSFKN